MSLTSGSKLGPYEILSPLGAGGMGEVYRARDSRLARDVAIKVLPEEFFESEERRQRFEREARLLAALNHPGIAAIYSFEEIPGSSASDSTVRHLLVMELLQGETLRERLRAGPLPPRRAVGVAIQMAKALAAAHEKGIVHRDLKPENVFLTKDERVKILDFGLAKVARRAESGPDQEVTPTDTLLTGANAVLGTAGYMSPEQVRGEAADHRSDYFSFGTILYEMLSGTNPFRADTTAETMTAILREEPSLSSPALSGVPGLSLIVARCLEKAPERRFHSSEDLAFALEALSQPQPAFAGPGPGRGGSWRLRAAVILGGLGLVILTGVLATRRARQGTTPLLKFTRVTFGEKGLMFGRFTPEGQSIVYSAWGGSRDENGVPIRELFTARVGSPERRSLGIPRANILSISRSGEMAVSLIGRSENVIATLGRAPLGGGEPREILEDVRSAEWSPDGETLAVIHRVDRKDRLEFPVGHVLLESVEPLWRLRMSPDGTHLGFVSLSRGLIVADLQGNQKVVADTSKPISSFEWLPDGRRILLFVARESTDVFELTLEGDCRLLVSWPGLDELQDIAVDGRLLVKRTLHTSHVFVRGHDETRDRELDSTNGSQPADLSDDGRTLLFNVVGGAGLAHSVVYVRRMDGSPAKRLGEGRAAALSGDGKLALCYGGDWNSLMLVPTGAGETRSLGLAGFGGRYGDAGFHPGGRRIWFSTRGPDGRCYSQAIEGGETRPVTPVGVTCREVSPDGKWLLVQKAETRRQLQLQPVDGGPVRPGPTLEEEERVIRWSGDGRWLFVIRRALPVRVFRIDPFSGRREMHAELDIAPESFNYVQVAVSGDGKAWAWSYFRFNGDFFVVEGLK